MKQFIVRAAVVSLAVALACQVAAALDEGSWLSQKLGYKDAEEAQRAVEQLGTAEALGLSQESPINQALVEKKKAASEKLQSGQDALDDLTELVAELDSELKQSSRSNGLLSLKAEVHMDRATALRLANKPIEALVEVQKARSICRESRCPLALNPNQLIHSIEDELKVKGNYAVLGLKDGASASEVSQARNSLYKLVHPDKNMSADPKTRDYLLHLFKLVDAAAKAIQN